MKPIASATTRSSHSVFLVVVAVVVAASWLASPDKVLACSGFPVPPTDSTIKAVVVGQISGFTYPEQHPENELEPLPITLIIEVDRYLVGSGPMQVFQEDHFSATGDSDDISWSGICRTFNADPTGMYGIFGITSEPDEFSPYTVYGLATTLDDPQIVEGEAWVLARIIEAAATGGLGPEPTRADVWPLALLGLLLALLVGARRLTRTGAASRAP